MPIDDKDASARLSQLRADALGRIERAAKDQDTAQVVEGTRRLDRIERLSAEHNRLAIAWRRFHSDLTALSDPNTTVAGSLAPSQWADSQVSAATSTSERVGGRRHAKQRREEFVEELAGAGVPLSYHKGVVYMTSGGSRVALPFGIESRPDRWFLGQKEGTFDQVILLCEQASDGQLEWFSLGPEFFAEHGAYLSRQLSQEQIKFVVVRRGRSFALSIPDRGELELSSARHNSANLT